jgi:glycosyltransferase involved in cell wall biosynthesis
MTKHAKKSKKAKAAGKQATSPPLVSCICPTYGRPPDYQHLLEEAIESFLRQTYPHKELIVLNDCREQELVCDAPGVRVINISERFPTLGDKYNVAILFARGALIAPWEDDDISLPWRLTLSVERLGRAAYYNPRYYWFLDGEGLHAEHIMGVGHNLSLFTRDAFDAVGGYPAISGPQDLHMDDALRSTVPLAEGEKLTQNEWFYIYRWGVSPTHLSGHVSPEEFYRTFGERPVPSGRFLLQPRWLNDYVAQTRHHRP